METLKQKFENTRNNPKLRRVIGAAAMVAALAATEAAPASAEAHAKPLKVLEHQVQRDLKQHKGVQVAHGTLMIRKHEQGTNGKQFETVKYVENPVIADRTGGEQPAQIDVLDLESGRYAMGNISRKGHNAVNLHKLTPDHATVEFIPELKTTTPETLVQDVDFGHTRDGGLLLNAPFVKNEGSGDPLLDPAGNPAVVALEYSTHK